METLRIVIVGVGGQGNVLTSKLIGEAALATGVPVVMSETHGMAQRGGVVESSVVLGGALSPTIADGCGDVLLSFEPLEAVRALTRVHGHAIIITNTRPVVPFISNGKDDAYPPVEVLLDVLRTNSHRVVAFDARQEAQHAGNSLGLNMVMLGALYGCVAMPLTAKAQLRAIHEVSKAAFADLNIDCFKRGQRMASVAQNESGLTLKL